MKKILSIVLISLIGMSAFSFDNSAFIKPVGNAKSYVKTDYTISSKFGEYFRTANAKYKHIFNENGLEIENSEISMDGKLIDKILYEYDASGNLISQTCFDANDKQLWKIEYIFKNGLLVEENEYNEKDLLSSKSIYKYEGKKIKEETFYNGNGAITWKNIYSYDENGNCSEEFSYFSDGQLESKKEFKYNPFNNIQEIIYYENDETTISQRDLFRYDAKNLLTEIASYTEDNQVFLRHFYKYDAKGNLSKITSYSIVKKFGTTVNELIGMSDFTYQY